MFQILKNKQKNFKNFKKFGDVQKFKMSQIESRPLPTHRIVQPTIDTPSLGHYPKLIRDFALEVKHNQWMGLIQQLAKRLSWSKSVNVEPPKPELVESTLLKIKPENEETPNMLKLPTRGDFGSTLYSDSIRAMTLTFNQAGFG